MKNLLILSLVLATGGGSAAEDIQHLCAILPAIQAHTLVLLDIDDTLIQPAQLPNETGWGRALLSQLRATGHTDDEIRRRLWNRLYLARACGEMRPVEPTTPKLIADLQAQNVAVMGLTARSPELAWVTSHQLACLGINLALTAPYSDSVCLKPDAVSAAYAHGILYTAHADKGWVLEAFLKSASVSPMHLVFVDDRIQRVQEVEAAARRLDIPCHCYHYTRTHHVEKSHSISTPNPGQPEADRRRDPPPLRCTA